MKLTTIPSKALGQWIGYSGMATAFLAAHSKADAQVIYTNLDPDSVIVNSYFDIDFDSDQSVDLRITHGSSVSYHHATIRVPNGSVLAHMPYVYASLLPFGAPIAPGNPNFYPTNTAHGTLAMFLPTVGANYGDWAGQTGFVGFKFTAGNGSEHYGWIQLSVSSDVSSITVMGYGYESTALSAINAGDMGITSGIADAKDKTFNMQVAPNPTSDNALITFPNTGTGNMQMSLVNSLGETLLTEQLGNTDSYRLNLAGVAPGVYFVRLQDDKKVAFQKVIKQ